MDPLTPIRTCEAHPEDSLRDCLLPTSGQEIAARLAQGDISDVIDKIKSDPSIFNDVMSKIGDNPQMMTEVIGQLESTPGMRDKLMTQVAGRSDISKLKSDVDKQIPQSQRRRMVKEARRNTVRTEVVVGVRLTQSRQAKRYPINPSFPDGTIFASGKSVHVRDDIYAYYSVGSTCKNVRATKIMGSDVFGEMILTREPEEGRMVNFILDEFNLVFPK